MRITRSTARRGAASAIGAKRSVISGWPHEQGGGRMKRTLGDAATALGGRLAGDDHPYGAVATDSRTLAPGSLFVALRGPNFDGREFVAAAATRGAIGAIVERAVPHALPQVVVPDALRALQQLGQAWRADFTLALVAVAGSNGKTTVKEMTAAI